MQIVETTMSESTVVLRLTDGCLTWLCSQRRRFNFSPADSRRLQSL